MEEKYILPEAQGEAGEKEKLKKEVERKYKEIRKINDIDERNKKFREINSYKKLIESSIKVSQDFSRAEILTIFDIFNDLSKSVDAAYSIDEYRDNKAIIESLKDIILLMIGKINLVTGIIVDGSDIIKAAVTFRDAKDTGKQMNNSIDSMDKGIKQLKERRVNMLIALLAIKVYLEDTEYINKVFGNGID